MPRQRSVEKPHDMVVKVQLKLPVRSLRQMTEIYLRRFHRQLWPSDHFTGQFAQELIQPPISVRIARRLAGSQRQVRSPQSSQKCFQEALLKELLGFLPVFMTRQGELIEIVADFPRRKDKWIRKWLRTRVDRTVDGAVTVQGAAVIVTVARLGGIAPRTFAAGLGHNRLGRVRGEW